MIIVSLFGGLGNQLFQYACGKSVAKKLGVELKLDASILLNKKNRKDFTNRDFELSAFNIDAQIADLKEVRKYVPNLFETPKWFHQLYRIKRFLNGRHLFIERIQQRHTYISSIEKIKDNTYLYGYFQTEKFFVNIKDEIIRSLQLHPDIQISNENKKAILEIEAENSVSIHVRRGDYTNSRFELLELDNYYLKAIEEIEKQLAHPKFFIFSNDLKWAKNNFSSLSIDFKLVDINSTTQSYMDMILMSHCKHNIIANSSFSWWGAWLNNNPNKIVIAPKMWYKNEMDSKELIPEKWIRL
jgi:hypothetical protein